jgi:hypothetical protein
MGGAADEAVLNNVLKKRMYAYALVENVRKLKLAV